MSIQLKLMVALRNHKRSEGVDVEIRDESPELTAFGGGWVDAPEVTQPVEQLLNDIWDYCEAELPKDQDWHTMQLPEFERGRCQFAERIQRMIAASGVVL